MTITRSDDVSMATTLFFLKLMGFWIGDNRREQLLSNIALGFTIYSLSFGFWIQTMDICHTDSNFQSYLYDVSNLVSLFLPFSKLAISLKHKKKFFQLLAYVEQNFLNAKYDENEASMLASCKRECSFFVCYLAFFTHVTVFSFIFNPLIANIGQNDSHREFPFRMWVNVYETPYFEMCYALQSVCVYFIGLVYFSFDNTLCILNLHLARQFRILQYRLSNKRIVTNQTISDENSSEVANNCYQTFKENIRQHQSLIEFCDHVEGVFTMIVLIQVVTFSLLICMDGFQMLLADDLQRQVLFIFHFAADVGQLLMFSYGCDCIVQESIKLVSAVYDGPWLLLAEDRNVKNMKKDVIMVIMRSSVPCCLTGCGFFMVSMEISTKVLTTAGSYFTLLQQTQDAVNL